MTAPEEAQRYGSFFSTYSGHGYFRYLDGHESASVPFWTGQCHDGQVVLACQEIELDLNAGERLDSFRGDTDAGLQIATSGSLQVTSNAVRWRVGQEASVQTVLLPHSIDVGSVPPPPDVVNVSYGLTNLALSGSEGYEIDASHCALSTPLSLQVPDHAVEAHLIRRPDYDSQIAILRAIRGVAPTAELRLSFSPSSLSAEADSLATDLCRVLSIAKGTRVQWIYRCLVDEARRTLSTRHVAQRTAHYSVAPLIGSDEEDSLELRRFIEVALPAYMAKRHSYDLDGGIIDAYLDGKADDDVANMKGLKLVTTMEMLAHAHLRAISAEETERILLPDELQRCHTPLRTTVHDCLLASGIDEARAGRIARRVNDLVRRRFEDILEQLFTGLDLTVSDEDSRIFVSSRNSLAHHGRFWSSRVPPDDACPFSPGWDGNVQEYFFLEALVDRAVLRLLDYDGPYLDWRGSPDDAPDWHGPIRRPHVNERAGEAS